MKKRLLVTGASGFLGWNVCTFPQNQWEIYGTYNQNKSRIPDRISAHFLSENAANFDKLLEEIKPDAILHLAAQSNISICEKDPTTAEINTVLPQKLAKTAQKSGVPFFFTSTEQVFDGNAFLYKEESQPSPKHQYGHQKVAAEKFLSDLENTCIIRLPCLFGNAAEGTRNFLNEWLRKWKNNEPVTVFHDEIRSFLSGQSAAEGLFVLLNNKAKGIYHLTGKEAVSRFEFAQVLKEKANLPHAEIISKSQNDFQFTAYRPSNLTLYCEKIKELGFIPKNLGEELEKLV